MFDGAALTRVLLRIMMGLWATVINPELLSLCENNTIGTGFLSLPHHQYKSKNTSIHVDI